MAQQRRIVLAVIPALLVATLLPACGPGGATGSSGTSGASNNVPITGAAAPGMASYDRIVTALMAKYHIPGGAVAVVKNDRLVFAHGYGWADVEHHVKVQPDALFRVASLSKPVTSAAIMLLNQEGRLKLSNSAFGYLTSLRPPAGTTANPQLASITVEELLQHSGGWDRSETFDPMFASTRIADAVDAPPPADARTIIRYMLGQPLQFTPGRRYAYSNFGYDVLGRVIESVTGADYATWVAQHVLDPAGVLQMQQGRTRLADALPGEVRYYAVPGQGIDALEVTSVFPGDGQVPMPYGGFCLEAMDSHGGWVSSTVDYLRFLTAVDGEPGRPDLLSQGTIATMTAHPPAANQTWTHSSYWYAMGWDVRPSGSGENWWHAGSLPGTTTLVVRAWNGLEWAAFFNARVLDANGNDVFAAELDQDLWTASRQVTSWPAKDLFSAFR